MLTVSERFAQQDNFLTKLDPRLKVVICGMLLGISLTIALISINILISITLLTLLMFIKIPLRHILLRLAPGVLFSGIILIVQYVYQIYPQQTVLLMISKVLSGLIIMIMLSVTTTMAKIIYAARCFRVPLAVIEIATLAHHYIFVLIEEIERIYYIQRMRLGYAGWRQGLKSAGILGGMVILKSFERSENLNKAMCCRGYRGDMQVEDVGKWR